MIRFREVFPAKKSWDSGLGRTISTYVESMMRCMQHASMHAMLYVSWLLPPACMPAAEIGLHLLGTHYLSLLWTRYTKEQSDAITITALVV